MTLLHSSINEVYLSPRARSALEPSLTDQDQIRNFCIIAHIDHGKSTLADRMLQLTGIVDDRQMRAQYLDRMDIERERGITIKSQAVRLPWELDNKTFALNMIDTPGHVDFTVEVERSLRVLDGGVAVFDGSQGVEPQSETVWRQSDKYHVPRLCFINKMDKTGADFEMSVNSILERLSSKASPIQLAIGTETDFRGIIDIVEQKAWEYKDDEGKVFEEIEVPAERADEIAKWRLTLIEKVAEHDDDLMQLFMEGKEPTVEQLKKGIRKAVVKNEFYPIFISVSVSLIGAVFSE